MPVRLLVRQKSEARGADKPSEAVLEQDVITLGRDSACNVVLPQQAVSRSHARISRDGTLYFLEDLGSSYGTQINGRPLPKGEKYLLRNGDIIAIAQFDITFDRVTEQPKPGKDQTQFVARQAVKDVMRGLRGGLSGPYLRVMNGPEEGRRIEVGDAQELVFGRDERADVQLNDDLVSREHAKVRRDWSGTHVEDLGSRNGIRVNKKPETRATLKDRDELEIGGTRFLYLDPSEVPEAPIVHSKKEDSTVAPVDLPNLHLPDPAEVSPQPEDSPEELAASEQEAEEESDDEEEAPSDEPQLSLRERLLQPRTLVPLVIMFVFVVLAILLTIAVFI